MTDPDETRPLRQEGRAAPHDEGSTRDDELLEAIVGRLRAEGAASGLWLADIARVRQALQAADDLLLEIQRVLIDSLPPLEERD